MGNFIILIGGPGLFKACDKAHDQSWTNYIVPLQLAAQKNLYKKQSDEVVHWVLYEPPYEKRWTDDSVITSKEKKESDGAHLHSIRKTAAERILKKGATSYVDRIKSIAAANLDDMINATELSKNSALKSKFVNLSSNKQISKFYGCYTEGFAKEWHKVFGVSAAGAEKKVDFGVIDRPSNIVNVMERIEKTPTSMGQPDWTVYK